MARPILIPVVHRPPTPHWRTGVVEQACRVVPHYLSCRAPEVSDPDRPLLSCGYGFEANTYDRSVKLPTDWIVKPSWLGRLTVTDYYKGRSSSCYVVRIDADDGGEPVVGLMSCSAFMTVIPRLSGGGADGTWIAVKRGGNYLIDVLGS